MHYPIVAVLATECLYRARNLADCELVSLNIGKFKPNFNFNKTRIEQNDLESLSFDTNFFFQSKFYFQYAASKTFAEEANNKTWQRGDAVALLILIGHRGVSLFGLVLSLSPHRPIFVYIYDLIWSPIVAIPSGYTGSLSSRTNISLSILVTYVI